MEVGVTMLNPLVQLADWSLEYGFHGLGRDEVSKIRVGTCCLKYLVYLLCKDMGLWGYVLWIVEGLIVLVPAVQ